VIVVFIPTYHNITCMCVPLVGGLSYLIALLRFALTLQHAQSLFLSSVSSLLKDWLTVSGLELEAAVGQIVFKDTLKCGVRGV
jgi:hypothetical protein